MKPKTEPRQYISRAKEFYLAVREGSEMQKVQIKSSQDANKYVRNFYDTDIEIYESFFLLMLNRKNFTTAYAKISQGGISGTVVDIKIILKYLVDNLCSGFVLIHNHPSGNSKPSDQDENITKKTKEAAKLIDCDMFDHLILTKNDYYSFADEGKI